MNNIKIISIQFKLIKIILFYLLCFFLKAIFVFDRLIINAKIFLNLVQIFLLIKKKLRFF